MKKWIIFNAMLLGAGMLSLPTQALAQPPSKVAGVQAESRKVVSRININTADAKTLDEGLLGVGPAKAQAIIAWRKQKGPFKAIAELSAVKGMGPALIERNKDRITLR